MSVKKDKDMKINNWLSLSIVYFFYLILHFDFLIMWKKDILQKLDKLVKSEKRENTKEHLRNLQRMSNRLSEKDIEKMIDRILKLWNHR